ncbi:MAG: hypothetical protein U0525_03330 [Patescibacteria group bacterium]
MSSDNSKIVYSVYPEVDPYKDESKVYIYDVNTKKKIEVKLSDYDRLRSTSFRLMVIYWSWTMEAVPMV